VEILSVGRGRDRPFFGSFPEGVKVTTLEDKREKARPADEGRLRRWMRESPSVLMHPAERASRGFNLWVDLQLVRALRRRCGLLVTTRPGLNLIAAQLQPPGLVLVGQEHMHLREHPEPVRQAMKQQYRKLAVLAVLTERDRRRYSRHLGKRVPIVRVPNAVRDMGDARADLTAPTCLAAGRFARQKGYDRLLKVWARLAPDHPDWRLRILGEGPQKPKLERLVAENDLAGSVSIERPARDMGAEMSKASIFVLSSRWEGLPLVLLEAMSVRMAVVSFDCPTGPADVIEDHVNGLLVRPRTLDALEGGLREMMGDEELRRRCAAAATETVRDYTVEAIGARWEQVFEDARRGAAS
jgi:glycosyltransferase involved in cell wall biosynthesis